jgi:putative ABC transport system permease protein
MALVVGLVVLFMVVNTMTMNVMERVNEIGTLRALGMRRGGIRRQFLLEGLTLGVMGASLGLVLALLVAALVNGAGLTWLPPNNTAPQPLRILLLDSPPLIFGVWLAMAVVAVVSSFFPARHAARLPVADALRHV